VSFSFAPNYPYNDQGDLVEPTTLLDSHIKALYVNAVRWASPAAAGNQAAPQSITFAALSDKVFGNPDFTISASTTSGLPASFTATGDCSVAGTSVSLTAAGSCTITAHQAGNDDFQPAADVSQSFTIAKAAPVLHWTPANLSTGTPLGPSQLNATATGLTGSTLDGQFTYTPALKTVFNTAGAQSLSVQFHPSDLNYADATKSVSINVSGAMNFSGFYAPLRNMPYVNKAIAGSSIPVKFAIGGFRGLQVLQANSPTSVPATCPVGAPENAVRALIAPRSGLHSLGSSYTYVWKTSAAWEGTCRKFQVTLADGSTHEAMFRFIKASKGNALGRLLGH
jgi:hypothetical protein